MTKKGDRHNNKGRADANREELNRNREKESLIDSKLLTVGLALALWMLYGACTAQSPVYPENPPNVALNDPERFPPRLNRGRCHGNCVNGQGIYEWQYGRYEGGFKAGQKHGLGVHWWPDGAVHEGEYMHDMRSGLGVYTWPDNAVHMGMYEQGQKSGLGMYHQECGWNNACETGI